jgi:small subunit ribosomal protein S16
MLFYPSRPDHHINHKYPCHSHENYCKIKDYINTFLLQNSMVIIRLARGGAKKRPFFNMVVANSRSRRDGRFLERIGFYNPRAAGGEEPLRVQLDRVAYWQSQGAQLSATVSRLVKQFVANKEASSSNTSK